MSQDARDMFDLVCAVALASGVATRDALLEEGDARPMGAGGDVDEDAAPSWALDLLARH